MSVLTWRNVDAPDFRPAMEGVRNATNLLSNAFTSAGDTVDQYKGIGTEAADRAIIQRLANVQDPSQFDANAIIGSDGNRASTTMLKSVADRPTTLLEWAAKRGQEQRAQQEQDYKNWVYAQTQNQTAALDAASPEIQKALIAQREGRTADANRILSGLSGLNSTQLNSVISNADTIGSNDLSRRTSEQNLTQSNWRFGNEQTEYGDNRAGDALADAIVQRATDAQTAAQLLDASGASAAVKNRALARLSNFGYQGVYGPVGTAGGGAAPSGSSFAGSIPYDETRNYVSSILSKAPDMSGMSIEQKLAALTPLVLQQETGNRRYDAKGNLTQGPVTRSGERAQGEMQVMPATSSAPGYGVKPAQNNSPEELARVGRDYLRAMLNKYDGNVDQALAAYNAGPGNVDQWVKQRASTKLDAALTNAGTSFGTQQTGQRLAERANQNFAATGLTPDQYQKALADTSDIDTVVDRMTGEGSRLAGTNKTWLRNQITRMQEQSARTANGVNRITPAVAEQMILGSLTTQDNWKENGIRGALSHVGRWFAGNRFSGDYGDSGAWVFGGSPNLGNNRRIDDKMLGERMKQYLTGQTSQNMEATQSLGEEAQVVQNAQSALEAASARLAQLRQAGQGRPGFQPAIQQAILDQATAQATLDAAQRRIVARDDAGEPVNPTLVPTRDHTRPVKVSESRGAPRDWFIPGLIEVRRSDGKPLHR